MKLPLDFRDHPDNPLIEPPFLESVIADPTVVTASESPDGQWHLFAHGMVFGIHHFVSADGVRWRRKGRVAWGMRPFILREGAYHLFFERMSSPFRSEILCMQSDDLERWGRPVKVLAPSLPWEGDTARTNGNPCILKVEGRWWMYYSAGLSWLNDCGFPEPRHIGLARAANLLGPYEKLPYPVLSPSSRVPHRNLGAGAVKVLLDEGSGTLLGFNNGIYTDREGRSRSDIRLLISRDGVRWEEAADRALVAPGGEGWKRALAYAVDVRRVGAEWWMYYNARDGWLFGRERIGLAVCGQ